MTDGSQALEFVRYILQQTCTHTDEIQLEEIHDDRGTLITIKVHDEDMGKIIGKKGQMIAALRLLVKAIGSRTREKINIKVLEEEINEEEINA